MIEKGASNPKPFLVKPRLQRGNTLREKVHWGLAVRKIVSPVALGEGKEKTSDMRTCGY